MATTFYNRTSSVEDFLRSHKSKLDEDKLHMRGRDSAGPVIGISPTNEGRDRASERKRFERQNEHRQYSNDNNYRTTNPSTNPQIDSHHHYNTVTDIRRKMQKEREIEFDDNQDNPINQRMGVAKPVDDDRIEFISKRTTRDNNNTNNVDNGLIGLGRIGYREEESPEEKRQRQSRYREELMKQMQTKGDNTVAIKMGSRRLFEEEPKHNERHSKQSHNNGQMKNNNNSSNEEYQTRKQPNKTRIHHRNHNDEDDDDDHFNYRPTQYKGYPYYPPPGPGAHPPSQYHMPPYYYPTPYPHMYPPPHPPPHGPHPFPHGPHPSNRNQYYPPDMSYGNGDPYRQHNDLYERSPPRVHSPVDYSNRSRQSSTIPYKEERRSRGRPDSPPKGAAAEFKAALDQQVKEKKAREEKQKRELDKFYGKIDAEAEAYDPWGKPGGGAPLTDHIGNVVTERGQLRKSYDDKISPRMSEEDRKKMMQEKTKRDLEEQIKEKQERQMKEKYKRQLQEEIEELKLLEELKRLNTNGQMEKEGETTKKKLEALQKQQQQQQQQQQQTVTTTTTPTLTAQELAEQRFKQDLEKKRKKQEEDRERLDRLAEKMASDSKPSWKQRSSSPPIPTLRNQPSFQIPPYPSSNNHQLSTNVHPSTDLPVHPSTNTHVPSNIPAHPSSNIPAHPPSNIPANPLFNIPAHPATKVSTHPLSHPIPTLRQDRSNSRQRNSLSRPTNSHVTGHMTTIDHTAQHVPNVQPSSRQLSKGFSDLKNQIRKTMIAATTEPNKPIKTTPTPPSAVLKQFNQLKYNRPNETRTNILTEYPHPPHTNIELEIQQNSLLQKQQQNGIDHRFSIPDIQSDVRPRPPTGASNYTIATLDIDSLANRNEERARRLDAILNANDRDSQRNDPQTILDNFLYKQRNERRPRLFDDDR